MNGGVDRIDTSFEELRADVQKKLCTAKSKEEYVSQCKSILKEIAKRPDSDKFLGVHENVKTLFYDFTPELIREIQESIEEERKKSLEKDIPNLTEIALNLGSYLASLSPQTIDGSLQYYFSGSLATMILANAESITEVDLNESNKIGAEISSKYVTEEQRMKIAKFTRKLGRDIDVVNVNGSLFGGAPIDNKPHIQNIIQHVPQILSLMSEWKQTRAGSAYIDSLEGDRKITYHPVARVKTKDGDMYVTAPPELMAHKLSETIFCISQIERHPDIPEIRKINEKYEKDIKDLTSMFYGFKELYGKDEFLTRVYTTLEAKKGREALFSTSRYKSENKNQEYLTGLMEKIMADCGTYLEDMTDYQSSMEIREFLTELLSRRKTEVERQKHTKKTLLQQKEAELSLLEAESRKISEAEAIIEQQKEGHDMGDE